MRKSIIISIVALAAGLVSCRKTVESAVIDEGVCAGGRLCVTGSISDDASAGDSDATKTTFTCSSSHILTPVWKEGDEIIGLWGENKSVTWNVKDLSDGKAVFQYESGSEPYENGTVVNVIYAPGKSASAISGTGGSRSLTFDLSSQAGTLERLGEVSLMTGTGTVSGSKLDLTFTHSVAVVSLDTLKGLVPNTGGYSIRIEGDALSTCGKFGFDGGILSFTGTADNTIATGNTFTADANGNVGPVYFAFPTSEVSRVYVTVSNAAGTVHYDFNGTSFVAGDYYYKSALEKETVSDFVIIGGKKWLMKNLGATSVSTDYQTCCGDYYQWGSVKILYSKKTWNGNGFTFTWRPGKESGYVEANLEYTGNANLPPERDVVRQRMGNGWRMPTAEDFKALYDSCRTAEFESNPVDVPRLDLNTVSGSTTQKGIYHCTGYGGGQADGILFVDGQGQRLFIPCVERMVGTGFSAQFGVNGNCWSSSIDEANPPKAHNMYFWSPYLYNSECRADRYLGFPVRPVADL